MAESVTVLVCREGPTGQAEHEGMPWLLNSALQLAWRHFLVALLLPVISEAESVKPNQTISQFPFFSCMVESSFLFPSVFSPGQLCIFFCFVVSSNTAISYPFFHQEVS